MTTLRASLAAPADGANPALEHPVAARDGCGLLADRIDAALPQTQCRRCGYEDCRAYADAIAAGAGIDRCPPGGAAGIDRLAAITGRPVVPLDPATGSEGPLKLAFVDEAWCIGCTLCIAACPVDCIVGAPKRMHTVVAAQCTGCELCVPACPVDCIVMVEPPGADPSATGWAAWSEAQAAASRQRHDFRRLRLAAGQAAAAAVPPAITAPPVVHEAGAPPPHDATPASDASARLRSQVAAAIERARRSGTG